MQATESKNIRLGVNVDHVATLRQARGTAYPDPVAAARIAASAGADSITIHLREDRRHIQDHDVQRMCAQSRVPVNLEMAVTPEMIAIACAVKPRYVCLVPERRAELTTEGGLNVAAHVNAITSACKTLKSAGIEVALFIDADDEQLAATQDTGAPHIEIHTGHYADASGDAQTQELARIAAFAARAHAAGLEVHAGHGLTLENVAPIARIAPVVELNIGHSIIARALLVGFAAAVAEMRDAMLHARHSR
ncbi:pyridoxine 5'-phosphate synthase [Sinimarinibacterium sp. NLF-5-8]|nr:pyridoxine 5'-phosphate synthase [Sinimarinibacterium sp. NLF-5-8]